MILQSSAPASSETSSSGAVLLVEDTMTVRLLLADQVEQMGHTVTLAKHGKEALALLEKHHFDLILLDVYMPELDGFGVLQVLKSDPRWQQIPVLVVSAASEHDAMIRCIEMGADDFLQKPCDGILLRARVTACLEKKRFNDQREQMLAQREQMLAELHQNYAELQKYEELRDSLTNMIVHDMRAPLTSIVSGLEMIEFLPEMTPDKRDELLALAHQGGKTLMGMINDLLDISKMEAGAMNLNCGPVTAHELIEISVHQLKALLTDRALTLQQFIAPDLPKLWCDAPKISRVLVNLLGNAIKFTPREGMITLAAQKGSGQHENFVQFSVCDTGEGIPREAFARIFEKFGQVENRKAGRKMSSGLGLTFCKMTIEAHGGEIWLESEIGKGSTFYFTVPLENNLA